MYLNVPVSSPKTSTMFKEPYLSNQDRVENKASGQHMIYRRLEHDTKMSLAVNTRTELAMPVN